VLLIANVWLFVLGQGVFVGLFVGAAVTSDRDLEFLALPDRTWLPPVASGVALLFLFNACVFLRSQLGVRWPRVTQELPDPQDQPVLRARLRGRHAATREPGPQESQGQVPALPRTRRSPQKKNKGNLFKRAGKGDVRRADTSVHQEPHLRGADGLAAAGTGSSRGNLKTEPVSSSRGGTAGHPAGQEAQGHRPNRYSLRLEETPAEGSLR
jgi:hypothetical protein